MSAAITIISSIPKELVAISAGAIAIRDQLVIHAASIINEKAVTAANYDEASALFKAMGGFMKEIESQREVIKRPVLVLEREIDAAAKEGVAAVDEHRRKLGALVSTWEAKERERVAEEQRAAREAARQAEIAERQRQEEALRLKAELEADPGEPPKEIDVEEIRVRPILPAKVESFKGVTRTTVVKKAQPVNTALTPTSINGISLVKQWDEKAIADLMKVGVPVAGWELVEEVRTASTGR